MLRLHTLGGLSLEGESGPLGGAAAQRRRLAVLAVLAAAGPRGTSRDRLLALLWPEKDSASGRQALSQALYTLRRDAGADELVLGVGSEDLRLNPAVVAADVLEFEAAIARGAREEAVACYAGPFLEGVHLSGDDGTFERWVDEQRVRLGVLAERALESLAGEAQARGDHAAAARWWRHLVAIDPLRTRAAAGLIQALAGSGDRAGALRHADLYARRVREELGAEPSAVVMTMAERLRADVGEAADAPGTGLVAGRYRVKREIGRGGMAVVLLAYDVRHDRPVALKVLRPELNAAVDRERMLREIRVTARLQHPHILPLHDSGEHAGRLFYVMPYIAGENLRERLLREGTLPVPLAVRLARQVADALDHAHRHQIVHRDVKPENVLLSGGEAGGETHAIVADFGIVHMLVDAAVQRLTTPQLAMGTPAYMSPEQATGEAGIDARSDVFALGCVLYEMLAGRPPWVGATTSATLAMRFTDPPPPLRELRFEVPPALEAIVVRALAVEPGDRFATAAGMARALAAIETGAAERPLAAAVPAPPTELVGRERERRAAMALLARPDVRLLTLAGAGGSGKTALALQLAADAASTFEAVAFVDLAAVDDAARVPAAIAAALGVRDREDRSGLDAVAEAVGARRMLLVLDNMEQVVGAAPDVARLLALAPRLTVLATSRVRLRVRGEHEFFVAPLELPDLSRALDVGALEHSPAVALFVRRAREARPDLALDEAALRTVAEICVRLDGLPLAIELAAARTRLLGPRAILARLEERRLDFLADGARDLPARQRTLRGAIAWSHDLLDDRERRTLRALGAFAGPFALDAACAVLDAGEDEALELVHGLADASLVRRVAEDDDGPRLALLETIREYARELLRDAGEEPTTRDRHLRHYLALAERVAPQLTHATQGEALARLERERANLRAALEHAATRAGQGDAEPLTRMARALWRAWLVSGQWTEGREWLRRAVAHAAPASAARAELLAAAAALAQNQGDYADAYASLDEALAAWHALGDRAGEARALASLGWLAWRRGQLADGRRLSQESLALRLAVGDERGAAQALNNIGWIALFEGRCADAATTLGEALALRRRVADRRDVAFTLTALAWARGRAGEARAAADALDEALELFRAVGERQLHAFATAVGAELALAGGHPSDARALLEQVSVPTFREIGDRWGLYVALGILGDALLAAERTADARATYEESDAIARALDDGYGIAMSEARHALVAAAAGDATVAARRRDEAERVMRVVGGELPPWLAERLKDRLRTPAPTALA